MNLLILKPRNIPLIILQLEALLERLPLNHHARPKIEKSLAKYKKGHRGEQALDYYFDYAFMETFFILHGIRLQDCKHRFFQIDTLLLTPSYFCILEVKNLSGVLHFNPSIKQTTRKIHGIEEGYLDPISQVYMQKFHLTRWLQKHIHTSIDIHPLVIISHPTTIIEIKNNFKQVNNTVLHAHALIDRLNNIEEQKKTAVFPKTTLREIAKKMVECHIPHKIDTLKEFGIEIEELILGVRCGKCQKYAMIRAHGRWTCPMCGKNSKYAHIKALEDYSLIINETITNKEARIFLRTNSRNVITHLLKTMKLSYVGKNRYRVYRLPDHYPYQMKV